MYEVRLRRSRGKLELDLSYCCMKGLLRRGHGWRLLLRSGGHDWRAFADEVVEEGSCSSDDEEEESEKK